MIIVYRRDLDTDRKGHSKKNGGGVDIQKRTFLCNHAGVH